jgi:divalent metal cation (Fe/Co/Zn/Cd) transporter
MAIGAFKLSKRAFHDLIDVRLPESEIEQIRAILGEEPALLGYHRLRTRRSGMVRYVDMHVVVPREWSVVEAHDLADRLEKRLAHQLAPANVVIHVDPFNEAKAAGI